MAFGHHGLKRLCIVEKQLGRPEGLQDIRDFIDISDSEAELVDLLCDVHDLAHDPVIPIGLCGLSKNCACHFCWLPSTHEAKPAKSTRQPGSQAAKAPQPGSVEPARQLSLKFL
jgi:hypothetical protein